MKKTAALCALALLGLAGFTGGALAEKGGDPGPPAQPGHSGSAPGQEKKAQPAPAQTTPAAKASKPAKPKPKPKPKAKASTHAKAGKITICHRTGSEKNPFVQITVSANAWKAHQKHRDLNPVPAGGCPTGGQPGAGGGGGGPDDKITICHKTGSETNPFVVITISENAWPAHQQHGDLNPVPAGGCPTGGQPGAGGGGGGPDDKITICHKTGSETNPFVVITISENAWPAHQQHGDLNPVPAGGCPTQAQSAATAVATTPATTSTTPGTTTTAAVVALGVTSATTKKPSAASSPPSKAEADKGGPAAMKDDEPEAEVLGAARELGETVRRQNLPFTGLPLWVPLLAGAGLAGTGLALRRWRRGVVSA